MCKHVCLSKHNIKTIFVDFSVFYGILFQSKRLSFNPFNISDPELAGRPGRSIARSTAPRAGRPCGRQTCTDVHAKFWLEAGRPTRSTVQRALLSGKAPVDQPVDRTESCALCIPDRSTDRSTDGTTV